MHFLALLGFMLNLTSVEHSSYKNYCIVSYENSLLKKKIPGVLILSPFPWLLVFRTGESPAGLLGSWSSILHVTPNASVAALLSAGSLRAGPQPWAGTLSLRRRRAVRQARPRSGPASAHCLSAARGTWLSRGHRQPSELTMPAIFIVVMLSYFLKIGV